MEVPRCRVLLKLALLLVGVAALAVGGTLPGSFAAGYRVYDLDAYVPEGSCTALYWLASAAAWSYRVGLVSAAVLLLATGVMAVSHQAQRSVTRLVRFAKVVSGVLTGAAFILLYVLFYAALCDSDDPSVRKFPRGDAAQPSYLVLCLPVYPALLAVGHFLTRPPHTSDAVSEAGTEQLVNTPSHTPASSPAHSVKSGSQRRKLAGSRPRSRSRSRSRSSRRSRRHSEGSNGMSPTSSPSEGVPEAPVAIPDDVCPPAVDASPSRLRTPYAASGGEILSLYSTGRPFQNGGNPQTPA